jgi:uncharacterized phiE125 gp8 family phage protein
MIDLIYTSDTFIVSLDQIKSYLRVDHAHDDELILTLVRSATRWAEHFCSKSFLRTRWKMVWNSHNYHAYGKLHDGLLQIRLPHAPLLKLISAEYIFDNERRSDITKYTLENRNGKTFMSFNGIKSPKAEIVYETGYGDLPHHVPSDIHVAIMMKVANLYNHRENDAQVPNENHIESLLMPYRSMEIS